MLVKYPMLTEEMLRQQINISALEKQTRTASYRTFAHNLKYFKDYNVLLNAGGDHQELDDTNRSNAATIEEANRSNADIRNQFNKLQAIDEIKFKWNEGEEDKKRMFGADTLENMY